MLCLISGDRGQEGNPARRSLDWTPYLLGAIATDLEDARGTRADLPEFGLPEGKYGGDMRCCHTCGRSISMGLPCDSSFFPSFLTLTGDEHGGGGGDFVRTLDGIQEGGLLTDGGSNGQVKVGWEIMDLN